MNNLLSTTQTDPALGKSLEIQAADACIISETKFRQICISA